VKSTARARKKGGTEGKGDQENDPKQKQKNQKKRASVTQGRDRGKIGITEKRVGRGIGGGQLGRWLESIKIGKLGRGPGGGKN